MSTFDFSVANLAYILEARKMIEDDPVKAAIGMRLNTETIETIKNLTSEEISLLSRVQAPLMAMNMDATIIRDMKTVCETPLQSNLNKLNDHLMLIAS